MPGNDSAGSDSDSDSDWNEELINAVRKKEGKSETINEEDRMKRIQECLNEGADVDTVDKNENTALHLAVKKGYVKVIRFLIEQRARTDILDRKKHTVFNLAQVPGNENLLRALKGLADHGNPRASTSRDGILPDNRKRRNSTGNKKDDDANYRRRFRTAEIDVEEQEMEEISFGEDSEVEEIVSQPASRFDRSDKYAASGLKQTLHGNIYQLKLLMLFLKRGLQKGYAFRLATEMDAAEKFDDLVFQYENNSGNETVYRFLQAKHKQDETKTVSVRDLLTETDGEFSLQKYFISFCKIRKHSELSKSEFKDFILCTNIDFDFDGLKSANICLKKVNESDDFLAIKSSAKETARYKFVVKEHSELYEILKRTAAGYTLAKMLVEHAYKSKDITLRNDIFKIYHTTLAEEVIDVKNKQFSGKFIGGKNLSDRGKKFREIFYAEALKQKKLSDRNTSQDAMWKEMKKIPLKLSSSFGQSDSRPTPELPTDEVDKKDIDEFFDKLVFAVNQPNEIELGDVITSEIAADSQFNLLNADLVGDSFQKTMLEWFKEKGKEKGKEGRFFSAEDGRVFFYSAEQKVNALVSSGLSLSYPEELKEYGVEFENENQVLRDFLISDSDLGTKPALNINATGETLPTVIRVHRAIQRTGRYAKDDSLLFLRLSTLRLPGIQKRVICAFQSLETHHLLVIDCESEEKLDLQELCKRLHRIMKNNIGKKLILITRVNEPSAYRSRVRFSNCSEAYDNVSFNDLTTESRYKLMGKLLINFQGEPRSTSFGKLLGIRGCDDIHEIPTQEMTNFGNYIDTKTLMKLLRNEEIKIGNNLRGLGEIEKYYIHRTIDRKVVIKNDILKSKSESDQFAISRADRGALISLMENGEKIRSLDEIDPQEKRLNRFIILNDKREAEQFETLCKKPSVNVHWLKMELGELIWEKSRGNIATLVAHRDVSAERLFGTYGQKIIDRTSSSLTEDQLTDLDEGQKVVIISDNAGMGKTTAFTYLARKIKEKKPGLWVMRIDLNDFTGVLHDELKSQSFYASDTNGAVEFLVEKLSNLETDLEKKVLKTMIQHPGELALLFDGFDEISPEYKNTVIDLLQAFAKIGLAKLYVATRPHMRGVLEDKLGVFSYAMKPFSEANQTEFLVRFWRAGLSLRNVEQRIENRLETYAKALTKKIVNSIGDWVKEFAGIPLQTQMMAEIFQDNREDNVGKGDFEVCEKFLRSSNDEPNLPGEISILDLYRRFVDKKYYRYRTEKKKDDPTNLGVKDDSESLHEIFLKRHQNLALHTLFKNKGSPSFRGTPILPMLLDVREIKSINAYVGKIIEGKERTGIITQVINGKSQFIHRTFAEYFSAIFLINTLKQADHNLEVREFIVKQILDEVDYKVIRAFLNGLLLEQSSSFERHVVDPSAAESWKLVLYGHRDILKHTSFHKAVGEGNYEIMRFLLNRFSKDDGTRKYLINAKNVSGDTILHVMASQQHWGEFKRLVENEGVDINCLNDTGRSPLHEAAYWGDLDMVQWLVGRGALPNALTTDGRIPLYEAVHSGRLPVLEWLFDKTKIDVNSRNKYGITILHIAASIGQLGVVEWLVKVKNADLNAKINDGKTVLHEAADKGQWEVVKWLIVEGKVDVNSKGKHHETILSTAVASGDLDLVKWLVNKGADFNAKTLQHKTILHVSVNDRRWAVFEWLVDQGADVNAKSWIGNTVLHETASLGKWDMVKWLIEKKGADVNAKGMHDVTVLHEAARKKQWDLVKWLLETREVDVNAYAYGGGTVVCHAASQERWETVEWLVREKNADVNSESSEGKTLLNLIALKNNWDLVGWLIRDKGADVNIRDRDGSYLVHHAASSGQLDLMKFLVEERGSDINLEANDGRAVIHCAAASGVMPLVKWLVEEKGADIEARSYKNETPIHEAASREHWDLVKWLVEEKGANVQVENNDGATVLHFAACFRKWELVRLLVNSSNVDVNAQTRHGNTVLRYVIESGDLETIEWLINNKDIVVNAKLRGGKTILHHAIVSGNLGVVQWLVVDKLADINAADTDGKTILHTAAAAGRCEIFKWLVDERAADLSALDKRERTVLHEAAVVGHFDMIRLIVESYNADVSATDDYHNTALDLYCKNRPRRNEAIVELLKRGNPDLRPRLTIRNRQFRSPPWQRLSPPRNRRREENTRLKKLSRHRRR